MFSPVMTAEPGTLPSDDPGTKRILIVDDDDDLRDLLVLAVTRQGFQVALAASGEEALAASASSVPDLMLLDLMMPRLSGYEVLLRLQQGAAAAVPVVVMTGRYKDAKTADMVRHESNVAAFLEKPIKIDEMCALLHRLLKTRPIG